MVTNGNHSWRIKSIIKTNYDEEIEKVADLKLQYRAVVAAITEEMGDSLIRGGKRADSGR